LIKSVLRKTSDVTESFLSRQSRVKVTSPSSQSHLKFCRVESESSHDLVKSSQSRVTRMVESLRVIGLQARVNVESYIFSNFSYIFLATGAPVDLQWL